MSTPRIKVVHVINSFEYGGAEAMLGNLLVRSDRDRFEPSVIALINDLRVAGPVLDAGIPITTMGMKPGRPDPRALARLALLLRGERPDVVQTWMDHSNLLGGLAARAGTRAKVVWGIHHADHSAAVSKGTTRLTVSACARLSRRVPDRIVCCSEQSRLTYERLGFNPARIAVIDNGFDVDAFHPDAAARLSVRRELGLDPDATLVGLAARFDPVKDHATFLRAASRLVALLPGVQFLLCGDKVDPANAALAAQIEGLRLTGCCHLLGPRRDMPRLYAALDVAVSSSRTEAFPLAVGEAMACGVPCVVTDVGDSARLLGPHGRVVPPRDPYALAEGLHQVLSLDEGTRRRSGLAARRRIRDHFELGHVTRRYEDLYAHLVAGREAPPDSDLEDSPAPGLQPAEPVRRDPTPGGTPCTPR